MTNINFCDRCGENKGKENVKKVRLESDNGQDYHLNYCKDCFEIDYPMVDWDSVEDSREYVFEAVKKAETIFRGD